MKITDIRVPCKPVDGFPQVTVKEPSIVQIGQLGERFRDFHPNNENAADSVHWFVTNFLRDPDGNEFEGVDKATVMDVIPNNIVIAALKACVGEASENEDELPES